MHRHQDQGLGTPASSHVTEPKSETSNIGTKVGHSVLGIKDIDKVEKDPSIPGPSHFRYPFVIYILVFLTISTAITILYLLSKYTSFGLLFNKKKKKKRLKRQLEIKKIPEESRIFDNITNYSVNDMPYENKTHDVNFLLDIFFSDI
ncbi:unspecified product [Plasmodium ovale wallikeri]|uniref:Unspecified product n=1 Tax=Plasmodium ovale wallikeri TaxID=864142 RepID=A0A1A9AHE6_PLAOA|nr:unspecified product [Plasmodium ovale wallikeri]